MVVEINFHKFLYVACVETLLVIPLEGDENNSSRNKFRRAHIWKLSKLLEAFWSTSKLSSARSELEEDDQGGRRYSRDSSATYEIAPSSTRS